MCPKGFQIRRYAWIFSVCTISISIATAQVRPDAGSLSAPQPLSPTPLPAGPAPLLPILPPVLPPGPTLSIKPAAFLFAGNTIFSSEKLAALLADRINQTTDLAGLTEAVRIIANFYRQQDYLLTEVYLPEQTFQAEGGSVKIAIIEARIGRVSVQIEGQKQERISREFAQSIVLSHLQAGAAVTGYALEKPVLLLREMTGYAAEARVEPGLQVGEADVIVTVRAEGPRVDGFASVNNHGTRAAGAIRAMTNININNLLGLGDVLTLSGQQNDVSGTRVYSAGYTLPVGGAGTRIGFSVTRLDYALGRQFAALDATGIADVLTLNLSHPLIRSRTNNLYGLVSVEQKKLRDKTTNPLQLDDRKIDAIRAGLTGQYIDSLYGLSGFNAYRAHATLGHVQLDPANFEIDQGAGGLNTAGTYGKLNLDYQRTQFFSPSTSLHASLQLQAASRNLASAEKMSLGGPDGVRAYPVGESIGDTGFLVNLEYRYRLPQAMFMTTAPVTILAFYDYGQLRFNKRGAVNGSPNSIHLGAVGIGASVERTGSYAVKAYLAWRTTDALPTTGDPDCAPRAWLSVQKWF